LLRLEHDCPKSITELWNLAECSQEIGRCGERDVSLGLVPDNAKLGQFAETTRSLCQEAGLPTPWRAHD
jgi:hypothetical protein